MKTLKLRIRDKHIAKLNRLSGSVNFVWNYVNDLSYKHLQKTGKFFSAYDLNEYTKGSGELLGKIRRVMPFCQSWYTVTPRSPVKVSTKKLSKCHKPVPTQQVVRCILLSITKSVLPPAA